MGKWVDKFIDHLVSTVCQHCSRSWSIEVSHIESLTSRRLDGG